MRDTEFYSLDLFAGAGGTSLGLDKAGFTSIGAVEKDEKASMSYHQNFGPAFIPSLQKIGQDIRRLDPVKIQKELRALGIFNLDLLVATPPCQGFSSIGRGKLKSLKQGKCYSLDARNNLYNYFLKFVRELQPKAILFENVPGILNIRGLNVAEVICDSLALEGYNIKCSLLNSSWYGVPQSRERAIIIGIRSDLGVTPRFPVITCDTKAVGGHWGQAKIFGSVWSSEKYFIPEANLAKRRNMKPAVSVQNAFHDLPDFNYHLKALKNELKYRSDRDFFSDLQYVSEEPPNEFCKLMRDWEGFESSVVKDHFCRWNPRDFDTFKKMKCGDKYPDAVKVAERLWEKAKKDGRATKRKDIVPPYKVGSFADKWKKLYPDRLAWTLTAHLEKDSYSHIHYDSHQARTITVREAARLQSFPDGFEFVGSMGEVFRQIGNAVPPLMACEIGKAIKSTLMKAVSRKSVRQKKNGLPELLV